jgi:hypothetical protein
LGFKTVDVFIIGIAIEDVLIEVGTVLDSIDDIVIATLGPSWNFSLAENLASLSLQDGPQSGTIF